MFSGKQAWFAAIKDWGVDSFEKAKNLLHRFRAGRYLFGTDVLARTGALAGRLGQRAALVRGTFPGSDDDVQRIRVSLAAAGVEVCGEIRGARPNSPREDVDRITRRLAEVAPEVIVSFGGGSTIDATKAADVLAVLGGDIDDYFGTGLVTEALKRGGKTLTPHMAVQTVAGSAAHLTKYANITDMETGQKKLIVDDAIVPAYSAFDYGVTHSTPEALTADGALDGLTHMLEVLYGAVGRSHYETAEEIAAVGCALVFEYLPSTLADPHDGDAREALCLATDLGGIAIMTGGTNGGHLTSFSLVDILPHGRACGVMNPYYTVFFAPAIEKPLRLIGGLCRRARLTDVDPTTLAGRELGLAVAEAMLTFSRRIGVPTRLADVEGFTQAHIDRALAAAKDEQLKLKLQNMPVPMTAEMVDAYMGPVLEAARAGDLSLIKNVP